MNPRRTPERPAVPQPGHRAGAVETPAVFRQALLLAVLVAVAAVASPLGT